MYVGETTQEDMPVTIYSWCNFYFYTVISYARIHQIPTLKLNWRKRYSVTMVF